jgi:thiamine transport system substrate-binding protein
VTSGVPGPVYRRRQPLQARRVWLAIGVAVLVGVAGYAAYAYWVTRTPSGEPTLTVYTYPSLFGGSCSAPAFSTVFGTFESAHKVHIDVECPPGTLLNALAAEKGSPRADLAIGLDEITAPVAEADGLLTPYRSPALAHVPGALVAELSPALAVTPYEYGYLALDYCPAFANATSGAVGEATLPAFAENASWADNLIVENPTTDITGEEFLLAEIAFYQGVLHEDWTAWWRAVDPHLAAYPSWSDAFNAFTCQAGTPGSVVSYSTDPAYAANAGTPGAFGATVFHWDGSAYSWRTIYGIGIVRGSAHLELDEAFVDWFLGGTVQAQIPTTEWEYPANATVPLPPVYASALNVSDVVALNPTFPPSSLPGQLPGWLDEWQTVANG